MKRPYIICHMMTSMDGKIIGDFMNQERTQYFYEEYGNIMMQYESKAMIMGRVTLQEMGVSEFIHNSSEEIEITRTDYIAEKDAENFTIALDPVGRLGWTEERISQGKQMNGEHIIEIVTEEVSSSYLNHLQKLGISYIFGGKDSIDFNMVVRKLKEMFSIDKLLVLGGGVINGLFLDQGLIDEVSLIVMPFADGCSNSKTVFDIDKESKKIPITDLILKDVKKLNDSGLWLTYTTKKSI